MNFTDAGDYFDDLDGNYLACAPGNVANGLAFVCLYAMPTLGILLVFNGLFGLYLTGANVCHQKQIIRQKYDDLRRVPSAEKSALEQAIKNSRSNATFKRNVLLHRGISTLAAGLTFFLHGFGTSYPTSHIRGQMGDISREYTPTHH
jgi:hypothetical protein